MFANNIYVILISDRESFQLILGTLCVMRTALYHSSELVHYHHIAENHFNIGPMRNSAEISVLLS